MSSGRYGNLLTVLLILAIVSVVGLLIFLGVDLVNKYYLEKDNNMGVEQFNSKIPDIDDDDNTTTDYIYDDIIETIEDNAVNNSSETSNPFGNTGNQSSNSTSQVPTPQTKKVVYYKGFVQSGTISISRTGLNCPVLEKETKSSLEVAVAIRTGPGLNEIGNTVIAGHNYRNGSLFSKNSTIQVGDKINIKDTSGRTVTYVVYNKFETTPEDASYITKNTEGKREITLVTCNDDSSRRIIIEAREQ